MYCDARDNVKLDIHNEFTLLRRVFSLRGRNCSNSTAKHLTVLAVLAEVYSDLWQPFQYTRSHKPHSFILMGRNPSCYDNNAQNDTSIL